MLPVLCKRLFFDLYSELANCYQRIFNGKIKAIYYFEKAIEIQRDIKPYGNSKIIQFYYEIGLYHQTVEEFSSAIQYFQSAQKLSDEQGEKDDLKSSESELLLTFSYRISNR